MQNILILEQSPKGNKFWVEENLRCMCLSFAHLPLYLPDSYSHFKVCAHSTGLGTRAHCQHYGCSTGRNLELVGEWTLALPIMCLNILTDLPLRVQTDKGQPNLSAFHPNTESAGDD